MKNALLLSILLFVSFTLGAQQADYRVVFDMTSRDTMNQQALVRELGLIRQGNPDARMEVVLYGQGIDLAIKDKCSQQPAVEKLLTDKGISIKICAIAMKRNNVDKSQLLPGVEVVPDGIYEIITRQREGWGYIKVAR
jgi:intracellular sulfur oxidation DsrE/DsrF family protein